MPDGSATALVVGSDDRVEKRNVELDRALGDQWVVTHGLGAGDRLIVAGLQKVKPGMQVAVRPPATAHQAGGDYSRTMLATR